MQLCHEQARCLCHNREIFFLVGWAREPAPKSFIENGATYEFQATLAIAVRSRGEVCPMPYALCPMPYARRVPHVTEKGYIMTYPKNSFGANNYARIFFARPAAAAIQQRSR